MQSHTSRKISPAMPLPSPPSTPKKTTKSIPNARRLGSGSRSNNTTRHGHIESQITTSRPDSSLSAYSPLPGIGHLGHDTDIEAGVRNLGLNDRQAQRTNSNADVLSRRKSAGKERPPSGEGVRTKRSASLSSEVSSKKVSRREMRIQQFARRRHSQTSLSVPDEPPEGVERLLIAIKLPEGERLQRHFRPMDSMAIIVAYAECTTHRSFSDCHLFTSGVPKRRISDLTLSIKDTGLGNRTLLFLEEKDE